ncbi:MAG: hypothetical protein IK999_08865 [Ruminococcus sp.]|nr:hypothetical protein [Ruminococcus sp.]
MENSRLAKIIFNYVKRKGGVSFVEFENIFRENGFDYKGHKMILYPDAPNIVVWLGWNQAAVDIIMEVIGMGAGFTLTSPVIYFCDGGALNLPIARTTRGYKKELHWLPVVMNVEE